MSFKRAALNRINAALNAAGMQILPFYEYKAMRALYFGPTWQSPPIPDDARAYLSLTNPCLVDLRQRYAGHPAAAHTQWDESNVLQTLSMENFRGENHYVYQTRWSPSREIYYITAYYVRDTDRLNLFGTLKEDGLFGAYTLAFDNDYIISRDLLDTINQINFIARMKGWKSESRFRVLDIGAGYGRLAYGLARAFAGAEIVCADAVPLSTFLCEFYLRHRKVDRQASVIALDEIERKLAGQSFDLVTNIHSFSECTIDVIGWWLGLLDRMKVKNLMIVPNARDTFLSTEPDGRHLDFSHLLEEHGWTLAHKEAIFEQSSVAQKCALYPNFCFHWFERR